MSCSKNNSFGGIMIVKYITSNDTTIGNIIFFTELAGDAPISVYVIRGEKGDMLIDTGFHTTYKPLHKWIKSNRFNITDIFLTHAHPDHDWNAAKLRQEFGARIWMSEQDISLIQNFNTQKQHPTCTKYIIRTYWINFWTNTRWFKSDLYSPDVIIKGDDEKIAKNYGFDCSIISLPGHTYGSIGILKDNILYCGDAYSVINGTPTMPPHAVSIKMLKDSYEKIIKLCPKYLACGHGLPFEFKREI